MNRISFCIAGLVKQKAVDYEEYFRWQIKKMEMLQESLTSEVSSSMTIRSVVCRVEVTSRSVWLERKRWMRVESSNG